MNTWPLKLCSLALALELSPAFGGALCQTAAPSATNEPSPSPDQLLLAARQYAARYIANLPSFVCTQITDQFEAGRKAKHWQKGDSLTSQLIWDQGREQRTLRLVNNRPVSDSITWRSPLVSEGEFGSLLDSVLGPSSSAVFTYRGREVIDNGKHVGIFEYQVDRAHSPMKLSLGDAQAVVPFRGFVYSDEKDGTVWRITNNATDFPPELRTKSVSRSVDYNQVLVGTTRYVLPVDATIVLDTGSRNIKNELKFDNYRKFGADSHITFTADDLSKGANGEQ